jgi:hypothetical protein
MGEDSLDIEIYDSVILLPDRLQGAIQQITEGRRRQEVVGAQSTGNMERIPRMRARRSGLRVMVGAERVLNDAAIDGVTGLHPVFRVDQKPLTADGAANIRREFRRLT